MSNTIASVLASIAAAGTFYLKPARRSMTRALVCEKLDPLVTVPVPEGELVFTCPTRRAAHDPVHLYTGEPETIAWIDALPAGAVMWDIGANVGTYALYAARHRGARIVAFEPSAATYAVLCANIRRNRLDALVDAYCIALAGRTGLDRLYMAHAEAGQSMHGFGAPRTITGAIAEPQTQTVPGFTIDRFCEVFAPPPPEHVKLDVDGLEHAIIAGGTQTLRRHTKSVLVEIDGAARDQGGGAIVAALAAAGFAEDKSFARRPGSRNVLFRR